MQDGERQQCKSLFDYNKKQLEIFLRLLTLPLTGQPYISWILLIERLSNRHKGCLSKQYPDETFCLSFKPYRDAQSVSTHLSLINPHVMELSQAFTDQHDQPTDHLNILLTEKIGYGYAQEKLSRSLYLLLFSQGCETIILGLLLPVLTHQWSLSTFQQSLLITIVYLGVSIGSYLQVYSDRFGRYNFILWDTALQSVFGLFSCFCWNYQSFLFARFFYGVGIGICLPLSASYITEISPAYMRATLLSKSRVYWSGGCLFSCLLAWIFLKSNSWRILLFIICLPGIYALIEHKLYGRQSLRYLWVQQRSDQVCELISLMCKMNGRPQINRHEIESLIEWDCKHKEAKDIPITQMFNQKYKPSTIRLLISWFSVCFIYYGVMILLPSILERVFVKRDQNFKYLFIVAISIIEVAGFYACSIIVDHPLIGRKKGVYYGVLIIFIVSCLIPVVGQQNVLALFVAFGIIKFVVSATFMILYPYTAQIYQTMIRGKALGICSMSGRVATALLGMVGVYAMQWFGGNGLYVLFIVLSGISGYGAYTMPYCTGNRPIS